MFDIGIHIIASTEKKAPDTMGQTFQTLSDINLLKSKTADVMQKAVGFRYIAVHNYEK